MNGRMAKKLKRLAKKNAIEYLRELAGYKFWNRWLFAWWLLFGNKSHLEK